MPASPRYFVNKAARQFEAPSTMEEAEIRRLALVEKVDTLNAQLSNRNATDRYGNRLDGDAYCEWRHRVVLAKRHTEGELRQLKLWIKQRNKEAPMHVVRAGGIDPSDAASLLTAMCNLVAKLAAEGVDLEPDEQALQDAARQFLTRPPLAATGS